MAATQTYEHDLCKLEHGHLVLQEENRDSVVRNYIEPASQITSWYNAARVTVININQILDYYQKSFLPRLFAIAGFAYGVEFLFMLGLIAYEVANPTAQHQALSVSDRLNKALTPERISRLVNSGVWFSINFTTFFLTGGLGAIINLSGFVFDIFHEGVRDGYLQYKNYKTRQLIQQDIAQVDAEKNPAGGLKLQQLGDLNAKKRYLVEKHEALLAERNQIWRTSAYNFACMAVFTTGMFLIFFPPTFIPGATLVGAAITMITGNILMGIGRRVYRMISAAMEKPTPAVEKPISPGSYTYTRICKHISSPQAQPAPSPYRQTYVNDPDTLPKENDVTVPLLSDYSPSGSPRMFATKASAPLSHEKNTSFADLKLNAGGRRV